jgi:hypothetical protein
MRAEKRYALERNRDYNSRRSNDDRKASRENNKQLDALVRRVPYIEYLNIEAAFRDALQQAVGPNDALFPRLNVWMKLDAGREAIAARTAQMKATEG